MVQRKWNNHEINEALRRFGECYELPPERAAALESRVRREVIARYGGFAVLAQPVVHTPEVAVGGMLMFLRGMVRPALAFAAVGVLVVGAVAAMRRLDGGAPPPPNTAPVVQPEAVVTSAPPITPGSGALVSVFTISGSQGQTVPAPSATMSPIAPVSVRRRAYRPARPLTPAEGVFTQWGTSVFSEEGRLQSDWEGKSVFRS